MNITFLGAVETVTGSKYLLTFDNKQVLIDCGLFQGLKDLRLRNWNPLPIDPKKIDAVILTHAHIDHSGYLPLLIKNGFRGKIYCSQGTFDLCTILLPDAGHLQEEEAAFANKYGYSKHTPALPLYTFDEAKASLQYFSILPYRTKTTLYDSFTVELLPSGHIVGATLVKIQYKNMSLLFTGDLGRPNDLVMQPPTHIDAIDYLVLESTYGDRLHETEHPKDYLRDVINRTIARGGSIIAPAFAVGRAQALLYYLYLLKKEKQIPNIPVYLDSPMAIDATTILTRHQDDLRISAEDCRHLGNTAIYINTPEASKQIDDHAETKIIISASGMATGGRILHHIKYYAPDERNTILFTGYQAMGTRGDRIIKGEKEVKMLGEIVPIKAEVAIITNASAHSDYNETLQWLSYFKRPPKKVFITHGDADAAKSLKEKIEHRYKWKCYVPHYQQKETLS